MDDKTVLAELEALAHQLRVEIRYEALSGETFFAGGMCRIRGRPVIIVNKGASLREKTTTLISALGRFDLNGMYLKPALRELLESAQNPDGQE